MLTKGIRFSVLLENGHKISKLVKCNDQEIDQLIEDALSIVNQDEKNKIYISKFIESAILCNQNLFEETYTECVSKLGVINFYKDILIHTMNKISILYLNSEINPANEHFLSENIRVKLSNEIEKITTKNTKNKKWILFLPENEYHDIGLLFAKLVLKKYNHEVIYLGQNVPRNSLLQFKDVSNLLFFLNAKRKSEFANQLCKFLIEKFEKAKIYVIDNSSSIDIELKKINKISNIDNFISEL
tara:strand:+ start:39 stop:767 length:729 start_codon:yes stop_codon:yes gene_type:complete